MKNEELNRIINKLKERGATLLEGANPYILNNWDTSKVTRMDGMFYGAYDFNQPLNNWNTSNVTNMAYMFWFASQFNQPLNNWNTSNVKNMACIFWGASSFNQPLNKWNVNKVKVPRSTFEVAAKMETKNKPSFKKVN